MSTKFNQRLEALVGRREIIRDANKPTVATVIDLYRNLHVGDHIISNTGAETGTITGYVEIEVTTELGEEWLSDDASLFIQGRNVDTGEVVDIPFGLSGICSRKVAV